MTVTMPPQYPQVIPEIALSCASHKLVISDAIKAINREVTSPLNSQNQQVFHFPPFLGSRIEGNGHDLFLD
jgi:hypothetical protein